MSTDEDNDICISQSTKLAEHNSYSSFEELLHVYSAAQEGPNAILRDFDMLLLNERIIFHMLFKSNAMMIYVHCSSAMQRYQLYGGTVTFAFLSSHFRSVRKC